MSVKKFIYIILTTVFGALLGCLAFGLLSLKLLLSYDWYQIFIVIGAIGGIPLGFYWWKVVYVEHRHWSNWKKAGK